MVEIYDETEVTAVVACNQRSYAVPVDVKKEIDRLKEVGRLCQEIALAAQELALDRHEEIGTLKKRIKALRNQINGLRKGRVN